MDYSVLFINEKRTFIMFPKMHNSIVFFFLRYFILIGHNRMNKFYPEIVIILKT